MKSRLADCFVLLLLAALVVLYGFDTYTASNDILNLILVLPTIVLVLVLCLAQFIIEFRQDDTRTPARDSIADVAPVIGLFAAYVLSLQWLGFDIGTVDTRRQNLNPFHIDSLRRQITADLGCRPGLQGTQFFFQVSVIGIQLLDSAQQIIAAGFDYLGCGFQPVFTVNKSTHRRFSG